jgi:hypothetical protein
MGGIISQHCGFGGVSSNLPPYPVDFPGRFPDWGWPHLNVPQSNRRPWSLPKGPLLHTNEEQISYDVFC